MIASALSDLPAQFESLAATQSNLGRMRAAGVKVAIGTINAWNRISVGFRFTPELPGPRAVDLG